MWDSQHTHKPRLALRCASSWRHSSAFALSLILPSHWSSLRVFHFSLLYSGAKLIVLNHGSNTLLPCSEPPNGYLLSEALNQNATIWLALDAIRTFLWHFPCCLVPLSLFTGTYFCSWSHLSLGGCRHCPCLF